MSQERFSNDKAVEETECTVNQELMLIKQNAQSVIEQLNMYFESSKQSQKEMDEVYFASIQELESGFIYLMNQFRQNYNEQKEQYQKQYEEKKFSLENEINKTQRYIQDLALLEQIDGSMSFMQVQKCLKNLNKISDEIKVFYNQTHVQSFQLETINVDALLMKILQNLLFDSIYQRPKTKIFAQKLYKQRSVSSSSQGLQTSSQILQTSSMYYTGSSCDNKEDEVIHNSTKQTEVKILQQKIQIIEKTNTDSLLQRMKSSSSTYLESQIEQKQEVSQSKQVKEKEQQFKSVQQSQKQQDKDFKLISQSPPQQKQEKAIKQQQQETAHYLSKYKTSNDLNNSKKTARNQEKEKEEKKSYIRGLKYKIPKYSAQKNVNQQQTQRVTTQQNQKSIEQINRTPEKKKKLDMLIQQLSSNQSSNSKPQTIPLNPKKHENKVQQQTQSSPIINRLRSRVQSSYSFSQIKKNKIQGNMETSKHEVTQSPQANSQTLKNEEMISQKLNNSEDNNIETEITSQNKLFTLKTNENEQILDQSNTLNKSIGLGQFNSSEALKLNSMSSKKIKMGITNPDFLQLSKDISADNIDEERKNIYTNRKRITSCGGFIEKQSSFNNLNQTQIVNHTSASLNSSPATNPLTKLSSKNLFKRDRSLSGSRQDVKEKFLEKSLQNDEIIQEFQQRQQSKATQQTNEQPERYLFNASPVSACLSSIIQQNNLFSTNILNQEQHDQCEFQESPQIFLNYNASSLSQMHNIQTIESISIEGRSVQSSQCEASLFRKQIQSSVKKAVIPKQQIPIDQHLLSQSPTDGHQIVTEIYQQKQIDDIQNIFSNPSPISHSNSNEMQLFTSQNFENGSLSISQTNQKSATLFNIQQKPEKNESCLNKSKNQPNQAQNSYRAIYLSQKNNQIQCGEMIQKSQTIQNTFEIEQNLHKNVPINKSQQNQRYNDFNQEIGNYKNNEVVQNQTLQQEHNQNQQNLQRDQIASLENQQERNKIINKNLNENQQKKCSFLNRKEDSITEFIQNEKIANEQNDIDDTIKNEQKQPQISNYPKQENLIDNQNIQENHTGLFYHSYKNHGVVSTRTINEEQDDEEEQSNQNFNNDLNEESIKQAKQKINTNLKQQLSNQDLNEVKNQEADMLSSNSSRQHNYVKKNSSNKINHKSDQIQSQPIPNNNFQQKFSQSIQKVQQNQNFQSDQQNQIYSSQQLENVNSNPGSRTNFPSQRDMRELACNQTIQKQQNKNINCLPPVGSNSKTQNNVHKLNIDNNQKQNKTEHFSQNLQNKSENGFGQEYFYQNFNDGNKNNRLEQQNSDSARLKQQNNIISQRTRSFSESSERIDYKLNYQPYYQNESFTKLPLSRSNSNHQLCTFERKIDKPLSSRQSQQIIEFSHNNCQQYFQGIEDSGSSSLNNQSANFGIISLKDSSEQRVKSKEIQNNFKLKVKSSQCSGVVNFTQIKDVESFQNMIVQQNYQINKDVTDQIEMLQKNICNQQKQIQQFCSDSLQYSASQKVQLIPQQIQDYVQKNQQKLNEKNQPVPIHKYLLANQKKHEKGSIQQPQTFQQQSTFQQFQGEQVRHKVNSLNVKNSLNSTSPILNPQPTRSRVSSISSLIQMPDQNFPSQNDLQLKGYEQNQVVCNLNLNILQIGGYGCESLGEIINSNGDIIRNINYFIPRNIRLKDPGYYGFSCVMLPQTNCVLFIGGYFAEKEDQKLNNKQKQQNYFEQKCYSSFEQKRIFTKDILKYNVDDDSFSTLNVKLNKFSYEITTIYLEKSNQIFLIGGRDENDQVIQDCMVISIHENKLIKRQSLPSPITGFSCTYDANKEYVFVLGGINSNKTTNCAYKISIFQGDTDQVSNLSEWNQMQNMINCRVGAQCKIIKKNLYVFGGYDGRLYLNSVEMYNFDLNKWFIITFMKIPRAFYSLAQASDQDKVLIIGGKASTQIIANNIDIFDVQKDQWQSINFQNIKRTNHFSFLLKQTTQQCFKPHQNYNHS